MGLVVSPFLIGLLAESVGRAEPVGFECFFYFFLRSIACLLFVGFLMSRLLFRLRFLFRFGGRSAVGIHVLFSDAQASGRAKSVDMPTPRNASQAIPKAPSSQSAAGVSNSAAPSAPSKGDTSSAFTLQFGSINPGMVNGLQVPARTSSSPPNLDEQKHKQACTESFRAVPALPTPPAPKQQLQQQNRKDVSGAHQSSSGESHSLPEVKRNVQAPIPSAPVVPQPKSSVRPIPRMPVPMPMPFRPQQAQVPPQFIGPNPQMQSPSLAANSLQMPMTLSVGNNTRVAQQNYVPNIRPHLVQQQAVMHQGQSLRFAPPIGHQLPPQLGNLGTPIAPQFPQQQPGKFGGPHRTAVKITHPETHEELRFERKKDSVKDDVVTVLRPFSNVIPQSQSIPTYSPSHQMNYYMPIQQNTYSQSQLIFPNSVPPARGQMPTSSQALRYNYPVSQSGQHLTFMSSSMVNSVPGGKLASSLPQHSISGGTKLEVFPVSSSLPTTGQVTMKPPVSLQGEKVGPSLSRPPVVISMPSSMAEAPESAKISADDTVLNQRNTEYSPGGPSQQPKSSSGPLNSVQLPVTDSSSTAAAPVLSTPISLSEASSAGDSGLVLTGNDCRKREPARISDSLKDNQRKPSKKDVRNCQQQHQLDAASPEGARLSPSKATKVGSVGTEEASTKTENIQTHSAFNLPMPIMTSPQAEDSISPKVVASEPVEGKIMPAASDSFGSISEREAHHDSSLGYVGSFGAAPDDVSIKEYVPAEATTSLGLMVDGTDFKSLGANLSVVNTILDYRREELGKSEASNDPSLDFTISKACPSSALAKSSEITDEAMMSKQNDGIGNSWEVKSGKYDEVDIKLLSGSNDDVGREVQESMTLDKLKRPIDTSLHLNDPETAFDKNLSSASDVNDKLDTSSTKCEMKYGEDVGLSDSGVALLETATVHDTSLSEVVQKPESKALDLLDDKLASATTLGQKEKPLLETLKPKVTAGKKKKRKEMLCKADAAGSSDLYNAYKCPEEKHEYFSNSESIDGSTADTEVAHLNSRSKDVAASKEDGQNKAELDDWEVAADISSRKLKTSVHGQPAVGARKQCDDNGFEATNRKKYSRDFLMTLSQQFTEIPMGFEIASDIADVLMSISVGKSPSSSPGRIIDRSSGASRIDRRTGGTLDDEKWTSSPVSFGTGPGSGHGSANVSLRPGQGASHGVLRNPRGKTSNQFGGGIPSGLVQSQGSMPHGNPGADRWQHARGLIASPQTPLQVMHKAEKKYEIHKASDQEEAKQRQLKAILNKLTPQNFDKLFDQVKDVNIDNAVTLTGVISQIFDKALTEPTFCEMYANFCFHLAGALPDFNENNEKITFKRLLLNKCQEEFERGEREQAEANQVEEEGDVKQSEEEREEKRLQARRRMLGNIRLIGELYKKKMLTERIMHECIKKLLGNYQNPDEEDVEALCKLMSTIGEMIDHAKAKEHMDAYFDMITKLSTNQKLSLRVRFMLKDAIDLRKNKWQQRRKIEGPKKIEEVHRDAAQERQAQSSRLARGPVINNIPRRSHAVDYSHRGSSSSTSSSTHQVGGPRGLPSHVRGHGTQDARLDDRHQYEPRTMSLPLPHRGTNDDSITLGPQGSLARGMSIRGHSSISNVSAAESSPVVGDLRRMTPGPNDTNGMADRMSGATYNQPSHPDRGNNYSSRDLKVLGPAFERSATSALPAGQTNDTLGSTLTAVSETRTSPEVLQEKSISAIKEYYSAKDENEVVLCIKELNAPSFYPTMISLWVSDSFERKDVERDLLAKLIINLCNSRDCLLSRAQLLQGFESVVSLLEDAVNDAPRAAEFLGRLFAIIVMEKVVPLRDLGRLILEGGEEPGRAREVGLAAEVLGSILETVRSKGGDSVLNDILGNSNLQLEDFRPPQQIKSNRLDAFLQS
ncbi:eukaryotic translation initiation factor [Musa troglodytarum]|uniref:Eukaryotic translation initiation factor 4G n=1 Tax=Musa troglodytarum TaxID=320322 RepID=A0A9E7JQ46_9LILI|nr:eukaryotic translation initiation factor [Musa troglodytarum]